MVSFSLLCCVVNTPSLTIDTSLSLSAFNVDDQGGNTAFSNDGCNGIFIQRQGKRCHLLTRDSRPSTFPPSTNTSPSVPTNTSPSVPTDDEKKGQGYFNYNPYDAKYGPNNWGNVKRNPEHLRFIELGETHDRDLGNRCGLGSKQSPIDLCENKVNAQCDEHHQTRTHVSLEGVSLTLDVRSFSQFHK